LRWGAAPSVIRFTNGEVCDDLDLELAGIYDAMRLPFD
jgi:hypothetical protein